MVAISAEAFFCPQFSLTAPTPSIANFRRHDANLVAGPFRPLDGANAQLAAVPGGVNAYPIAGTGWKVLPTLVRPGR